MLVFFFLFFFSDSDHQAMHHMLWYSEEFCQRFRARFNECLLHIYEINGTPYRCTHLSIDEDGKPFFSDTVLVAYGEATYVRSVPLPLFERINSSLPLFFIRKGALKFESVEADCIGHCSICLEDTDTSVESCKLKCSHQFHKSCIADWILRARTCPCCRFIIKIF